ncbi:MAG TPA: hypothetical protein VLD66_02815 [Methyloceanibacter sp.]|nr:hypothetical protein [Methyloceanibacter sp.]
MQVHDDEGVAIRIGPEPCDGVREGAGEVSIGMETGPRIGMQKGPPLEAA